MNDEKEMSQEIFKNKKKLWEKKVVKVNYYYIFFWRMWLLGANFACEIQTCIIINYV